MAGCDGPSGPLPAPVDERALPRIRPPEGYGLHLLGRGARVGLEGMPVALRYFDLELLADGPILPPPPAGYRVQVKAGEARAPRARLAERLRDRLAAGGIGSPDVKLGPGLAIRIQGVGAAPGGIPGGPQGVPFSVEGTLGTSRQGRLHLAVGALEARVAGQALRLTGADVAVDLDLTDAQVLQLAAPQLAGNGLVDVRLHLLAGNRVEGQAKIPFQGFPADGSLAASVALEGGRLVVRPDLVKLQVGGLPLEFHPGAGTALPGFPAGGLVIDPTPFMPGMPLRIASLATHDGGVSLRCLVPARAVWGALPAALASSGLTPDGAGGFDLDPAVVAPGLAVPLRSLRAEGEDLILVAGAGGEGGVTPSVDGSLVFALGAARGAFAIPGGELRDPRFVVLPPPRSYSLDPADLGHARYWLLAGRLSATAAAVDRALATLRLPGSPPRYREGRIHWSRSMYGVPFAVVLKPEATPQGLLALSPEALSLGGVGMPGAWASWIASRLTGLPREGDRLLLAGELPGGHRLGPVKALAATAAGISLVIGGR